ncbi:MAG: hypothetical protein Q8J65_05660 [Nitrosomonadales bacterium]|nr:hypothetical protein [Nitrosomonadales bacterium]
MKTSVYLVSILMMFATLTPAWSQPPESEEEVEVAEPCTPEEIKIEVHADNEVTYVSGGIGICESQEMRRIAKDYQLELEFVQKTATAESFLANIPVEVTDKKGSYVLDTVTKGPFLLAKLPNGRYTVTATFNGETKTQQVLITAKHQRLVFVWRVDY